VLFGAGGAFLAMLYKEITGKDIGERVKTEVWGQRRWLYPNGLISTQRRPALRAILD